MKLYWNTSLLALVDYLSNPLTILLCANLGQVLWWYWISDTLAAAEAQFSNTFTSYFKKVEKQFAIVTRVLFFSPWGIKCIPSILDFFRGDLPKEIFLSIWEDPVLLLQ